MSKLPWEASLAPESTQGDTTLQESALKNAKEFMGVAKQFETASQKLAAAAVTGDMAAIKKR